MIAFILSSKQITSELTIDFGDISPSHLPLANDYLLNFQVKELNRFCSDIYVSKRKVDKPYINSYGFHEFIVEENLNIKDLVIEILNSFQNEDVIFLYGDTLIKYPDDLHMNKSIIFS